MFGMNGFLSLNAFIMIECSAWFLLFEKIENSRKPNNV